MILSISRETPRDGDRMSLSRQIDGLLYLKKLKSKKTSQNPDFITITIIIIFFVSAI